MIAARRTVAAVVVAVAVACSTVASAASGPVRLKMKYQVGKRYVVRMQNNQTMTMQMPALPKPMVNRTNQTQNYHVSVVKTRPEGGVEIELQFADQKMTVDAAGRKMEFDSTSDPKNDAGNPLAPAMRAMAGAKLTLLVDAENRVEDIKGIDAMMAKLTAKAGPGAAMLKSMINKKMMRQVFEKALTQPLPAKAVSVGDSWPCRIKTDLGMLGSIDANMTYTFEKWGDCQGRRCAVLKFTGTVKSGKSMGKGRAMSMSIDNGTVAGRTWFDPELGWAVKTVSDSAMDMVITLPQQNKKMTQKIKQKQAVDLVDVADIATTP